MEEMKKKCSQEEKTEKKKTAKEEKG